MKCAYGHQNPDEQPFCGTCGIRMAVFVPNPPPMATQYPVARPLNKARKIEELQLERMGIEMSIRAFLELEDDAQVQMYTTLLSNINRQIAHFEANAG